MSHTVHLFAGKSSWTTTCHQGYQWCRAVLQHHLRVSCCWNPQFKPLWHNIFSKNLGKPRELLQKLSQHPRFVVQQNHVIQLLSPVTIEWHNTRLFRANVVDDKYVNVALDAACWNLLLIQGREVRGTILWCASVDVSLFTGHHIHVTYNYIVTGL